MPQVNDAVSTRRRILVSLTAYGIVCAGLVVLAIVGTAVSAWYEKNSPEFIAAPTVGLLAASPCAKSSLRMLRAESVIVVADMTRAEAACAAPVDGPTRVLIAAQRAALAASSTR